MNKENEQETNGGKKVRLFFGNIEKCQKTISRVIRRYYDGYITETEYKSLIEGIKTWILCQKYIDDNKTEKRLSAIESKINALIKDNG